MSARDEPQGAGALVRADHPWGDPLLSRLYDAFPFDADLAFYRQLAQEHGSRVLELACGTGRLLLPLARAGCHVVGVDASPHMLTRAKEKLRSAGREVEQRCRLVQGDFCSFDLGEAFDVVIIAVRSFAYLQEREHQQRCLRRIFRHIRPGGVVALDLLNPSPEWLLEPPGGLRQDLVEELDGGAVLRTEAAVTTDRARQVRVIRSIYEVIDARGDSQKRVVEWPFRYTYRFEAELLLEAAGFEVDAVYGGYAKEAFTSDSDTMLLLAERRDGEGVRAPD